MDIPFAIGIALGAVAGYLFHRFLFLREVARQAGFTGDWRNLPHIIGRAISDLCAREQRVGRGHLKVTLEKSGAVVYESDLWDLILLHLMAGAINEEGLHPLTKLRLFLNGAEIPRPVTEGGQIT